MKLISLLILLTTNSFFFTPVNAHSLKENLLESTSLVKAGEKYLTLLGKQINVGDTAPNFKVVDNSFSLVEFNQFKQKVILISVVPSLDTGVCSLQTKRFNEEVANFSENVVMLTISNDLPFAQKRFCNTEKINNIKVLSDSVWRDFGSKYGLLIKDMGLLTRAIIIIDSQGKIAYKELVANISQQPDYTKVLAKLKALSTLDTIDNINPTDNQGT